MISRGTIGMGVAAWALSCAILYFLGQESGYRDAAVEAEPPPAMLSKDSRAKSGSGRGAERTIRRSASVAMPKAGPDDAADEIRRERSRTPLQRLAAATSLRSAQNQRSEMGVVSAEFSLAEVLVAMQDVERMEPGPVRQRMLHSLLNRWAQLEPMDALQYALDEESPTRSHAYVSDVFRGWGVSDPAAALAYVTNPQNEGVTRHSIREIFEGLGSSDPAKALQALGTLNADTYSRDIVRTLSRLFAADPNGVAAFTASLPANSSIRQYAIGEVVEEWGRYDPEAARVWMQAQTGEAASTRTLMELGESWAQVDPERAVDWYENLPDNQRNPRILSEIVERWLRYEPETAAAWIVQQPADDNLDRTLSRYVRNLSSRRPGEALEWAVAIANEKRRSQSIDRVMSDWLRKDPAQAEAYLRTSPLPDELKRELMMKTGEAIRAANP